MLALSSGTARRPEDDGHRNASGFDKEYGSDHPNGFPKESPSCGAITGAPRDGIGLEVVMRAPANARGIAFDFDFYTYEWPQSVCSESNDFFVALMDPPPLNQPDGNISFDSLGNPVSVNNAFLDVCACDGASQGPCEAGGKLFEVSTTTLRASGSGYFEALLGSSGEAMRAGKKRARVGGDGDEAPAEIFVDRDPDIFGDVLKYMRANRLPAAVAADAHRLHDLKVEAEFLAYDRLVTACDEAEAALPRARMMTRFVAKGTGEQGSNDAWGDLVSIDVPAGEVLYVTHVAPFFDMPRGAAMDGGEHGKVWLRAAGSSWSVHAWLGHPSKIPGLSSKI